MKKYSVLILIIIAASIIYYFEKAKNASPAPTCLLFKSAHYFDGVSDSIIENTDILVRDSKIQNLGHDLSLLGQQHGCFEINARSFYIMPGLIDAHTHLLAFDKLNVTSWKEALQLSSEQSPHKRLSLGLANARSMLMHGFTTVRDLGNSGYFLDLELKKLLDQSDQPEIQFIYSGPGVAITPSQIDLSRLSKEYLVVNSKSDINTIIEKILTNKAQWLKLYADNSRGQKQLMPTELLNYFVEIAHQNNIQVAVHAEYDSSVEISLTSNADSIEHFYQLPHKITEKRPFVVITDLSLKACQNLKTIGFGISSCEKQLLDLNQRFSWLIENKFQIIFGSDAVLDFTTKYKNRGQAALAALLNWKNTSLKSSDILKSATSVSGKMLKQNIGQIKEGFQADLLITSDNPLMQIDTLSSPVALIKSGVIVCGLNKMACSND